MREVASSELALNTFHIMIHVCAFYISLDTITIRNPRNNIFHICHTLSRLLDHTYISYQNNFSFKQ